MQRTLKSSIAAFVAALALSLAFLTQVAWAAPEPSATVELKSAGDGKVSVIVKDYDKLSDATTASLALDINPLDAAADYLTTSFAYDDAIKATVETFSTDVANGKIRMNLYIANSETALFPLDKSAEGVKLGDVILTIKDDAPDGTTIKATVTVPTEMPNEYAALSVVGTDYAQLNLPYANLRIEENAGEIEIAKRTAEVYDPMKPETNPGGMQTPDPTTTDVVGQTPETNPINADVGDKNMPIIYIVVGVLVAAVLVIVISLIVRKKKDTTANKQD